MPALDRQDTAPPTPILCLVTLELGTRPSNGRHESRDGSCYSLTTPAKQEENARHDDLSFLMHPVYFPIKHPQERPTCLRRVESLRARRRCDPL